ncbi:MAG: type II toxin-antitoxin system VapC family toxin [Sphingomonas fennica]
MRWLIDTNCCIYLYSGAYPRLTERVLAADVGDIGISAIVLAELSLGSIRGLAPDPAALDRLIAQLPLLSFDADAARAYARLPFRRSRFDRLLAAHGMALGCGIITANLRDFADIPGLVVEDWTA